MSSARHCLLAAVLALGIPLLAGAAVPPAEVHGISLERQGKDIVVSWDAAGSDITYYRVYWSRLSILENAGDYDDSQETTGPETTLTLQNLPSNQDLYVAIIAVNANGDESPTFAEEATLSAEQATSSSRPLTKAPELKVVKVVATDATTLRITFSQEIALDLNQVDTAVQITDTSGASLPIMTLSLQDKDLVVGTAPQQAGKYALTLKQDAFYGVPTAPTEGLALLKKDIAQTFASTVATEPVKKPTEQVPPPSVRSSSSAMASSSAKSSASSVTKLPGETYVDAVEVLPFSRPDGYFDLEVSWSVFGAIPNDASLVIAQSADGGKTFGEWQAVASDLQSARIARIPPSDYAVSVAIRLASGEIKAPLTKNILLIPAGMQASSYPTYQNGVVGAVSGSKKPLTSSGPASLALTLILTGAAAGALVSRKVLIRK